MPNRYLYILLENVYSGHLPISKSDYFFCVTVRSIQALTHGSQMLHHYAATQAQIVFHLCSGY